MSNPKKIQVLSSNSTTWLKLSPRQCERYCPKLKSLSKLFFSEEELDSDESSGKDWSDLEREAEGDDNELDDDNDDRNRRNKSSSKHR